MFITRLGKKLAPAMVSAAIVAVLLNPAHGDGARHDEVLRAVRAGELRPLAEIMQLVRPRLRGDIVRVEAERKRGMWVYEIRIIGEDGKRSDVYVDGKTAEIIRVKRK